MAPADSDPHGSPAGQATAGQGEAVLVRAVAAYRAALGSRLIAGYALGSLAHGGFSPLVSDVDLGLILDDPVRARDRLTVRTVARGAAWRREPPPHGEAAALVSRELVPLYVHYLDDHIVRLRAVGRHRLAERFRRWRTRLLA